MSTSKTALLVMGDSDRDLSDLITRTFEANEVTVITQKNERGALNILHDAKIDFIATALALAPDSTSPARADGGIAFCEAARAISPVCVIAFFI